MKKIDYLSTLLVGIDIASRIHVISALDFNQEFFIKMKTVENTQEGAVLLEGMISDVLKEHHQFNYVVIGMESTGFYGVHLANYLSASGLLAPFLSVFIVLIQRKRKITKNPSMTLVRMMVLIPLLLLLLPCWTHQHQAMTWFPIPCLTTSYQTSYAYHGMYCQRENIYVE